MTEPSDEAIVHIRLGSIRRIAADRDAAEKRLAKASFEADAYRSACETALQFLRDDDATLAQETLRAVTECVVVAR